MRKTSRNKQREEKKIIFTGKLIRTLVTEIFIQGPHRLKIGPVKSPLENANGACRLGAFGKIDI